LQPSLLAEAFDQYRPTDSYVGTARTPLESRASAGGAAARPAMSEEAARKPRARPEENCPCIDPFLSFVLQKEPDPSKRYATMNL
jgi:hypothetical protein